MLSRTQDPLVIEAIQRWENEVIRAESNFHDVMSR